MPSSVKDAPLAERGAYAASPAGGGGERLTMVFQHFPPYPGAAALKAKTLADAIVELSPHHNLTILTTSDEGVILDPRYRVEGLAGRQVENTAGLASRLVGEIGLGLRACWRLMTGPRPDRLIISSPAYLMAVTVSIGARILRIPYDLEVRDIFPEAYGAAGVLRPGTVPFRISLALSRSMYRGARRIVAATRGLARRIGEVSGRDDVVAVYNGYPEVMRTLRGEKRPRFTVGFHGVMGFYQDVETLVAVARALEPHDIDVLVVGFGRKEDLLRTDPPANLEYLGRLPFERTFREMSRVHVGLCLRTGDDMSQDAFPIKLFEYIGLCIPSIVTPPCEGGAFARETGCGVELASGDVGAIVAEILRLRDDMEYRHQREQACEAASVGLTREALARDIARVFTGDVHPQPARLRA